MVLSRRPRENSVTTLVSGLRAYIAKHTSDSAPSADIYKTRPESAMAIGVAWCSLHCGVGGSAPRNCPSGRSSPSDLLTPGGAWGTAVRDGSLVHGAGGGTRYRRLLCRLGEGTGQRQTGAAQDSGGDTGRCSLSITPGTLRSPLPPARGVERCLSSDHSLSAVPPSRRAEEAGRADDVTASVRSGTCFAHHRGGMTNGRRDGTQCWLFRHISWALCILSRPGMTDGSLFH